MSITGMMRTSASGMDAQSNRLSAVADNIANATTNGYKRAHIEFSSFIPTPATADYQSGSVNSDIRHFISEQGNLNYTTSVTDLAVKGKGFLMVSDTSGQTYMTRAGSFVQTTTTAVPTEGAAETEGNYLINAAGYFLMGYPAGTPPVVNGTAGLEKIDLGTLGMQATATTSGTFYVNVPSTAAIIVAANLPSANAATAEWTATSSLVVYDNLGTPVTLDLYWAKSALNTWDLAVFDHATAAAGVTPFPYTAGPLNLPTSVAFDATTGAITTIPPSITLTVPLGQPMTIDLSQCTQLAAPYTVLTAEANGNAPSALDHIEIDTDGSLYAVFESGARQLAYQIPLGFVTSIDMLQPLPGDIFAPSADSGDIQIGIPGEGGIGLVVSSAVEQSTVDLASELTDMIEAQRNYEVNSKVFQTGDEVLQVVVSLKR